MPTKENVLQKETAAYVIDLVAAAVNSSKAPEKPEHISWRDVVTFAKNQSVLNLVAYACESLGEKPEAELMKFLREFRKQKIVVEAQQEIEACDVMEKLESMGIRYMPLKGYVVKNLYPSPDMRTMGDIDILVDENRLEDLTKALSDEGYTFRGHGDLHSNFERGPVHFEFHRSMVNQSYKNLYAYFGNGFDRAKKNSEYGFRYDLSKEDMYIFLLAHLAKHYRYGGTGIRTVLDLYIYRRAYPDLNVDYIAAESEKIGLNIFREKAEKIADDWFDGSFDGSFDSVSEYIISGGVYGTRDMNVVNAMINTNDNITVGKFKSIFSMIFPSFALMSEWFPLLKKFKILLPFFWVVRWIRSLTDKNGNLKNTLTVSSEILNVDDKRIAAQRDAGLGEL